MSIIPEETNPTPIEKMLQKAKKLPLPSTLEKKIARKASNEPSPPPRKHGAAEVPSIFHRSLLHDPPRRIGSFWFILLVGGTLREASWSDKA